MGTMACFALWRKLWLKCNERFHWRSMSRFICNKFGYGVFHKTEPCLWFQIRSDQHWFHICTTSKFTSVVMYFLPLNGPQVTFVTQLDVFFHMCYETHEEVNVWLLYRTEVWRWKTMSMSSDYSLQFKYMVIKTDFLLHTCSILMSSYLFPIYLLEHNELILFY